MDAGPSEPRGRITITLPPQYDPRKWERLKAELEMKINALEVDQYIFKLLRELWERRKEWPGLITNDSDADPVRIKKTRKDPLTQYKDITIHWDEMKPDYYEDVLAIVKKHTRQEYEWTKKRQERGFGPSDAHCCRRLKNAGAAASRRRAAGTRPGAVQTARRRRARLRLGEGVSRGRRETRDVRQRGRRLGEQTGEAGSVRYHSAR